MVVSELLQGEEVIIEGTEWRLRPGYDEDIGMSGTSVASKEQDFIRLF